VEKRMTEEELQAKMPTTEELEKEVKRLKHKRNYSRALKSTIYSLIVVAAIAVLCATLWMPVLRIYGSSMTPTLSENNIVLSLKTSDFKTGDVIAFYYNNKILVKRVIAGPGDWVDIDDDGNVYVNGEMLEEDYIEEKDLGESNIEYPYQVPESRWFVLGDHRSVSLDSRTKAIGPIAEEQIVGKLILKVWPLNQIGTI
jgi:signal peptidase I